MTGRKDNLRMLRKGGARIILILAVLMLSLPVHSFAQGCVMCGTAAGDGSDPLARSLSTSVLFMMSMPFVVAFSVGGWLVYQHRQKKGDS